MSVRQTLNLMNIENGYASMADYQFFHLLLYSNSCFDVVCEKKRTFRKRLLYVLLERLPLINCIKFEIVSSDNPELRISFSKRCS